MAITDELREYALGWEERNRVRRDLTDIADRIDAEHQKAMDEWKARDGQTWLKGYSECRAEIADGNDAIAADLEANGWIRLPLDADGVPIHVGDRLTDGEYTFAVCELAAFGDGSWSIRNEDGNAWAACDVTHHAPTVEDVLEELLREYDRDDSGLTNGEIVKRFAVRLRLREDA